MVKKVERKKGMTEGANRNKPSVSTENEEDLRKKISAKAYELYEKRGQGHGNDLDDWLEAEQLITVELKTSGRRV